MIAIAAVVLRLVGPHVGEDPGLPGVLGFAVECVVAMQVQGGVLAALVAASVALRRHALPATILGVVAATMLVPDLGARMQGARRLAALGTAGLRVAVANLAEQHHDDPGMLAALFRLRADVLVLPEYTHFWEGRLDAALRAEYPHRFLAEPPPVEGVHTAGFRIVVWSRVPPAGEPELMHLPGLVGEDRVPLVGQIRVPLRWQERTFALYAIHPRKPYPFAAFHGAHADRAELLARFARERLPRVIAGDFNAEPRGAFFTRLRRLGLHNASEAVFGVAPVTWPMHEPLLAPFRVALDHVMHDDAFVVRDFERLPAANSDHAAVVAELHWRE